MDPDKPETTYTRLQMSVLNRHVIRVAIVAGVVVAGAVSISFLGILTRAQSSPSSRGKEVYEKHCAECHGVTGKGDGPAAHLMMPHPRDFSAAKYKIRTTETGSLPSDEDLTRSVRQGLYGSAMPAWQKLLSDDDIRSVVAYLKAFSPRFASETPKPIAAPSPVPPSPASTERGAAVYTKLQCDKCHGTDGRGTGAVTTTFEDDWRQPLRSADLTEPWTFHGGSTSTEVFMRFRAGMSGTPMPSFKDAASDIEMWDLANYVVSLARKPVWEMTAEEVTAFYAKQAAEAKANPVRRGEYLVDTLGCTVCHSPVDQNKRFIPGMRLAGGVRLQVQPFGVMPTGNLTSDKETGLGNWTDEEIKRVITKGTLRDGTRLLPFPMDWPSFALMSDGDVNAIVAYLRTVPPVQNKVPKPQWSWLPMHLLGKFRILILGASLPDNVWAGNAGSAAAEVTR
jgi:mono/diheme cytochrome c family protein